MLSYCSKTKMLLLENDKKLYQKTIIQMSSEIEELILNRGKLLKEVKELKFLLENKRNY